MKIKVALLGLVLALSACSSSETTAPDNTDAVADTGAQSVQAPIDVVNTVLLAEDGVEKTMCNMGIEGMTCSIGCAGKIERTIANMEGVKSCKVDFEQKVAVVEYDNGTIDEKAMVAAVQELHNGQYSVTGVEVQEYKSEL